MIATTVFHPDNYASVMQCSYLSVILRGEGDRSAIVAASGFGRSGADGDAKGNTDKNSIYRSNNAFQRKLKYLRFQKSHLNSYRSYVFD